MSRWGYFIAENRLVHKMCIIRTNAVGIVKNRFSERWGRPAIQKSVMA